MAEWYKHLKMAAGIDTRSEENNAREKYKEALKTPKTKDLITWVDLWEKTMTVAKKKKVVETTKPSIYMVSRLFSCDTRSTTNVGCSIWDYIVRTLKLRTVLLITESCK
jgi:hypothetical protein